MLSLRPDSIRIETFGVTVEVTVSGPTLMGSMPPYLPPGWKTISDSETQPEHSAALLKEAGPHECYSVIIDGQQIAQWKEEDNALQSFQSYLQLLVAENSPHFIFIHAGVVSWRGEALLLPGRSFAGKSTLVAALLQAGADYCSDEYAVLDLEGRVLPYPRRISLRQQDGTKTKPPALETFGCRVEQRPLSASLIALTQYHPEGKWQPRLITSGEAALALLDNTVPARSRPRQSLDAIVQMLDGTQCLSTPRGEAKLAAEALLQAAQTKRVAA